MTLANWLRNGWLTQHATSPQEITDLFGLCDRDLKDARTHGLSSDWRFSIAYNALLQAATAALAASGYRAGREAHHYRVLQSLVFTIGADATLLRLVDTFRKKRNTGGYETAGQISDKEAQEIVEVASDLRAQVETWIRQSHPYLIR